MPSEFLSSLVLPRDEIFPDVPGIFPNVPGIFPDVPEVFPDVPEVFPDVPNVVPDVLEVLLELEGPANLLLLHASISNDRDLLTPFSPPLSCAPIPGLVEDVPNTDCLLISSLFLRLSSEELAPKVIFLAVVMSSLCSSTSGIEMEAFSLNASSSSAFSFSCFFSVYETRTISVRSGL